MFQIKRNFIAAIVAVVFVLLYIIGGNIYTKYAYEHRPVYTFEIIDKWQDVKGGFLSGSKTVYNIQVKCKITKHAGKFVIENPPKSMQIKRVSYPFYKKVYVGYKFSGSIPRIENYDYY